MQSYSSYSTPRSSSITPPYSAAAPPSHRSSTASWATPRTFDSARISISSPSQDYAFAAACDAVASAMLREQHSFGSGGSKDMRLLPIPKGNSRPGQKTITTKEVFSAARNGRHALVEEYLSSGCFDANTPDEVHRNTLLIVACQNGSKKIAKLAIKYGASIDAKNVHGNTGLHYLYSYGYYDVAEYLIKKGADVGIVNNEGKTCAQMKKTA
ncbi:hypothetical protein FOZ62_027854 [Perkinsus olseni]|uniref:Ankyrin Repeat Protein n=1 Tax=Perkinsus olseni TaxID=32597 RepID=A0A7J6S0B4_PEROL|nr:hypothetical protein FOZ62_027854 [Perkinsus olseni]